MNDPILNVEQGSATFPLAAGRDRTRPRAQSTRGHRPRLGLDRDWGERPDDLAGSPPFQAPSAQLVRHGAL